MQAVLYFFQQHDQHLVKLNAHGPDPKEERCFVPRGL